MVGKRRLGGQAVGQLGSGSGSGNVSWTKISEAADAWIAEQRGVGAGGRWWEEREEEGGGGDGPGRTGEEEAATRLLPRRSASEEQAEDSQDGSARHGVWVKEWGGGEVERWGGEVEVEEGGWGGGGERGKCERRLRIRK